MIETLSISNYALIDKINLQFRPGFNIITGETGAGKSIMLGALSMLFGNRADTKVVRHKDKKSIVEATFNISHYPDIKELFSDSDIDWDDNTLILRREIIPSGRSRSFINDSPVSLTQLRDVAVRLVDLHSQHQNLLLASAEYQLRIIDTLLPDKTVAVSYREAYEEYRSALKKYQQTKRSIETNRADEEYLRFQLEKLEELSLAEGEQQELEREREVLSNISFLKQSLARLLSIFSEGEDNNIISLYHEASNLIGDIDTIPEAESLAERIESLRIESQDIADSLESIDGRLEADPQRLEEVEERLSDIYSLQRKHNVETVEELIAIRDSIVVKLEAAENSDERLKVLAARAKKAKARALSIASALSEERQKVAASFSDELYRSAMPLGMKNLVIKIQFDQTELTPTGTDSVTFLFAFNKNQPLMPVKDTASGGEISRLMLTIKSIIADKINLPSIIFDEVDTGVSGDVANKMGDLMKRISKQIQVIAITHLPQVASKGSAHFKVFKEDSETDTTTSVKLLDEDERIDELALMLSGSTTNNAARETAKSLLSSGQK